MSEFIIAGLCLAVAGMVGFCVGRQSLWGRLEAAEHDADMARLGRSVSKIGKDALAMSSCIGDGMSYSRTGYVTLKGDKCLKVTFEVEA